MDITPLVVEEEIINSNELEFVDSTPSNNKEDHIENFGETHNIYKDMIFLEASWENFS